MFGTRSEDTLGGIDLSSDKDKVIYRQPQPCAAEWFLHNNLFINYTWRQVITKPISRISGSSFKSNIASCLIVFLYELLSKFIIVIRLFSLIT